MVPKSDMKPNYVNGLYPIIRRVRRPLLPVDWPADAKPVVLPGAAFGGEQPAQGVDAKRQQAEANNGEVTSAQPAE
jgi:hypothetical protein